jgi:hypothetical protein
VATTHGRYLLAGVIDGRQWAAGEIYLVARLRHRAAVLAPPELRSRTQGPTPERDDAQAMHAYESARKSLRECRACVERVLYEDAAVTEVGLYRAGLERLRRYYRV